MKQLVGRILTWYIKPAAHPRTVLVAEHGIKSEWFPTISNIAFKLASENEALAAKDGAFLFEPIKREGRRYSINVGWGDSECRGSGDVWQFRIGGDDKLLLWRAPGVGWFRGCRGNGPPTIRGLKLGEISPNELTGLEFFAKGKLSSIRLGISTKDQMQSIFGSSCEGGCAYDDQWTIWAGYFSPESITTETTADEKGTEIKYEYVPKAEFIGRLRYVHLSPKGRIALRGKKFSGAFGKNHSTSIGDAWGLDGFEGAVHTSLLIRADGYGLEYRIYEKETFNNLASKHKTSKPKAEAGDLVTIEYSIPDTLSLLIHDRRVKQ